jgi:hypothetical protein
MAGLLRWNLHCTLHTSHCTPLELVTRSVATLSGVGTTPVRPSLNCSKAPSFIPRSTFPTWFFNPPCRALGNSAGSASAARLLIPGSIAPSHFLEVFRFLLSRALDYLSVELNIQEIRKRKNKPPTRCSSLSSRLSSGQSPVSRLLLLSIVGGALCSSTRRPLSRLAAACSWSYLRL